jgi:hypothetical protein
MGPTLKFFQNVSVCTIDMDGLFACLDDMEGFTESNITHKPNLYICIDEDGSMSCH